MIIIIKFLETNSVKQTYMMGRYKQWNGLLEWNTGLDYWTELFFFVGQVSVYILEVA